MKINLMKMFLLVSVLTLAINCSLSTGDVRAEGELGKLANGEGKWAQYWKPIEV